MKKFLLKIVLCATAVLALGGIVTPLVATAEESVETPEISVEIEDTDIVSSEDETTENSPETVEETETSKWFDENVKPFLMQGAAAVCGVLIAIVIIAKKSKNLLKVLTEAIAALTKALAENKALKKEMRKLGESVTEALKEIREGLEAKVIDVDDIVHKLLDVEKIAYGNNAHLVSNGTAKRIAEVIGNGKKTENEE